MPSIENFIQELQNAKDVKHPYFTLHECSLKDTEETQYSIKSGRFRKWILDLTTVRTSDIRAHYMYRSYASLNAEQFRQFSEYPFSIHPFSKMRFWMEVTVCVCIMVSNLLMPFWISQTHPIQEQPLYNTMLTFDVIYLINIIANCFTGYVGGKNQQYVVLEKWKILCRYARTWMMVDAVCLLANIIDHSSTKSQTMVVVIVCSKVMRLPILFIYFNNICKVLRMGVSSKTAIEVALLLLSYLCWNVVFQFAVEYMAENSFTPAQPKNCSWISIGKLWNASLHDRFLYGLERAVGMLRENANMNLIEHNGCLEAFFIIAWLIAELLVLHCSFKYMIALFGTESARAKYYMMSRQVGAYVNNRRFPPRIKKKILKFYSIRFQSHFFVESRMMACVSGQLRDDMIMHTGRQLVRELAFLKQLPRPLLTEISLRFKLVIFIEGDIIFKIHTIGDAIYFIHKGTVAIYSESGRELCHFEDGEYFGGVALVMKNKLRTGSAVAVTNCELFSLSREDFEMIACYPTAYEEIKRVATARWEQMRVLDEQYKLQQHIWSGDLLNEKLD